MRMNRILVTLALVASLVFLSTAAFGAGKAETPSKTIELKWMGYGGGTIVDDNPLQKTLEQKFNVKIKNVHVAYNNKDQVQVMLASEGLPDWSGNIYSPQLAYKEGLSRTIPLAMVQKYMPTYHKLLSGDPLGMKFALLKGSKDQLLSIPDYNGYGNSFMFVSFYRLDWMEKLGDKPKGELVPLDKDGRMFWSSTGFTLAEAEKIWTDFVTKDPDGNGKDDTYAFSYNGYEEYGFSPMMSSFGLYYGGNLMEDGQFKDNVISNKWKNYVKLLHRYYDAGLLDKEWVTTNWDQWVEKAVSNRFGWWTVPHFYIDKATAAYPPWAIADKNSSAKILVVPPESAPDGTFGGRKTFLLPWGYPGLVGKQVDDEKLARILQIIEYTGFDKDAYILFHAGRPGVDFDWEGEPGKSRPVLRKGVEGMGGAVGLKFYSQDFTTRDRWVFQFDAAVAKVTDILNTPQFLKGARIPYKTDLFQDTNIAEVTKDVGAGPSTLAQEFWTKGILGQIDIDAEWDTYVQKWKDAGGAKLLAEVAKAPVYSDLIAGK